MITVCFECAACVGTTTVVVVKPKPGPPPAPADQLAAAVTVEEKPVEEKPAPGAPEAEPAMVGPFFCAHADSARDPVTGALVRRDMPLCRDINRGSCFNFTPKGQAFQEKVVETKEAPEESTPPSMRESK